MTSTPSSNEALNANPSAAQTAQSVRILIAEDNPVNRMVALHRLRKIGFTADEAENGREAADKASSQFYDLILMDVHMPVLDGVEAAQEIRAAQAQSSTRSVIIAVTASDIDGEHERFLEEMNADDYLPKPYRQDQMKALIDRWVTVDS